jgi:hypothetical protein
MRYTTAYLFICFVCSCSNESVNKARIVASTPIRINLSPTNTYWPMHQVIDSFWFVNLEPNDSTRSVGRADKILLVDKKIYVLDVLMTSVSAYDLQGKYLYDIGSLGLNKGQYRRVADIAYNGLHNTLYLLCNSPNRTIYEYSLSGSLIREIHLPNGATGLGIPNYNALFFYLNRGPAANDQYYDFAITDSNSTVKDMLFSSPEHIEGRIGITGGIYSCNDSFFINPPLQNTFYSITDSIIGARKYYADFGKDSISRTFTSMDDLNASVKSFSYLGKSFVQGTDFAGFNIIEKGGYFKQVFYNRNSGHVAKADTTDPFNALFSYDIFQSHDTLFSANYVKGLKRLMKKNGESIKRRVPGLYEAVMKSKYENYPVILFYKLKPF